MHLIIEICTLLYLVVLGMFGPCSHRSVGRGRWRWWEGGGR